MTEQPSLSVDAALETFMRMSWRTEIRAGVEHYVCGQHRVIATHEDPEDVAVLAYVPARGHEVIALPIVRDDHGDFAHAGLAARICCSRPGPLLLPEGFTLTPAMLAALDAADL